jgi:hypothetical protein
MKSGIILLLTIFLPASLVADDGLHLPKPEDVFTIGINPVDEDLQYFSPESLLAALPRFVPGVPDVRMSFHMRPPQRGVIVLKSGKVLFWYTQNNESIFIQTPGSYEAYITAPTGSPSLAK